MEAKVTELNTLKEYMKTLIVTQSVLTETKPREWGKGFSTFEINRAYDALRSIVKQDDYLSTEFDLFYIYESRLERLYWFLVNFYREIVDLIISHSSQTPVGCA